MACKHTHVKGTMRIVNGIAGIIASTKTRVLLSEHSKLNSREIRDRPGPHSGGCVSLLVRGSGL